MPDVHVRGPWKVYDDGAHNAFTDLCWFGQRLYLACRSCPDGHMVFASARIVVLTSTDGQRWEPVHSFSVPGRDPRDPHFLVLGDQLFVYTGTWLVPPDDAERDLNDHLGYAACTTDGTTWQGPFLLEGTYGHYIWRAATWNGKAYLCGRRRQGFAAGVHAEDTPRDIQSALLESDDGLIWRFAGLFAAEYGDETAFLFGSHGELLALVRGSAGRPAWICRSRPPFQQWVRRPLQRNVGGPLLVRWGERYLVGGRRTVADQPRTVVSWLVDDELQDVAELPSAGDNSYPGFAALSPERALLSYYSSHEGSTSVYMAELELG